MSTVAQTAACTEQPGGPQPPRLWSRASLNCMTLTSEQRYQLEMRRKAEILKYKGNSAQLTKKQQWSQAVNGAGPLGKKVWATQNVLGSNPNVDNLPIGTGYTLLCKGTPLVQCAPSSASDVPGKITTLCYDPSVPLVNYIVQRNYSSGGTKFPMHSWQPGNNGFPVGKAGKMMLN